MNDKQNDNVCTKIKYIIALISQIDFSSLCFIVVLILLSYIVTDTFVATYHDRQQSLTCLWDADAAMFNAKAGRSLADTRDNKNRPSTIAGYMDLVYVMFSASYISFLN